MRVYLASSWRNDYQPFYVDALRGDGHEVYDFKHPEPGNEGFHWSEIDPGWKKWNECTYRRALDHPVAEKGFGLDWSAMEWANCGVLLLPSGRSAHLEGGYFVGAKKPLVIAIEEFTEPELMYKMADAVCIGITETLEAVGKIQVKGFST